MAAIPPAGRGIEVQRVEMYDALKVQTKEGLVARRTARQRSDEGALCYRVASSAIRPRTAVVNPSTSCGEYPAARNASRI